MNMIFQLTRNGLMANLPEAWLLGLVRHLEPVDLSAKMMLEAPGELIEHVYFPSSGVVSRVAVGPREQRVEAGLIGREGMTGLAVMLGSDRSPHEMQVQLPGTGHRIDAATLRDTARGNPGLRDYFLRYTQAVFAQVAHTALSGARHSIEERLARWLLMCHDRVDDDVLELTHEFLSTMLSVRRAGVTVAIHILEGRGFIKATRGRIRILDRAGLAEVTRGVYGPPEAAHARLMGKGVSERLPGLAAGPRQRATEEVRAREAPPSRPLSRGQGGPAMSRQRATGPASP